MAIGTYSHTTLQQLVDQLAEDLSDSAKTFFTTTECQRAIVEALRLSNVLTARSRYTLSFNATAGTAWYDLAALAPTALGMTTRDRTAIENMQYRTMETVEPSAGVGMREMYSFAEFLRALQRSRDRILVEIESTTRRAADTTVDALGVLELDDAIAMIKRAVWVDVNGNRTVLRNPTDEGVMTAVNMQRRLTTASIPRRWSIIAQPQLHLQLDPIPTITGPLASIELTTIETGAALSTTANGNVGTLMGLPDDLVAGAVWDALELVLTKHGMGQDAARAELCSRLGTLYRSIGRSLPTVLECAVNGVDVRIGNVAYLDARDVAWEGRTRGIPKRAAVMGDWLALYPVPDDAHAVEVTIAAKLTEPALTDYIQLGREHLSGILAWAKQLLMFKVGGNPLARASAVAGLLIEQARMYNEQRVRSCQYLSEFLSQGLDSPATILRSAPEADLSGDPEDNASTRNKRQRDPAYSPYSHPIGGR